MTLIFSGLISGVLIFLAVAAMIEKLPPLLYKWAFQYALVTDVLFTVLSFVVLPVVGAATLVSTSVFCVIFSLYLWARNYLMFRRVHDEVNTNKR